MCELTELYANIHDLKLLSSSNTCEDECWNYLLLDLKKRCHIFLSNSPMYIRLIFTLEFSNSAVSNVCWYKQLNVWHSHVQGGWSQCKAHADPDLDHWEEGHVITRWMSAEYQPEMLRDLALKSSIARRSGSYFTTTFPLLNIIIQPRYVRYCILRQ